MSDGNHTVSVHLLEYRARPSCWGRTRTHLNRDLGQFDHNGGGTMPFSLSFFLTLGARPRDTSPAHSVCPTMSTRIPILGRRRSRGPNQMGFGPTLESGDQASRVNFHPEGSPAGGGGAGQWAPATFLPREDQSHPRGAAMPNQHLAQLRHPIVVAAINWSPGRMTEEEVRASLQCSFRFGEGELVVFFPPYRGFAGC